MQLSLGANFGCARAADGSVSCWGSCGNDRCGSTGGDAPNPRAVPGLREVTHVEAGFDFACALRADRTVWCWGGNRHHQLGVEGVESRLAPAPVPGITDARVLRLGSFHACVLDGQGQTRCWGSNSAGALGAPAAIERRASPAPVPRLPRATALWVAGRTACIRDARSRLVCWGDSSDAQAGTSRRARRAGPTRVRNAPPAAAMSLGAQHGCLLMGEGRLRCWGANFTHGDGVEFRSAPLELPGLSGVTALSLHGENQCVVAAGRVLCWGVNRMHQLAVPTPEAGGVVLVPTAVPGLEGATDVVVGRSAQCARLGSGQWRCWGRNVDGAVGVGSRDRRVERPTRLRL
ncbi:MAG: hypothetical protein OEY14_01645 [Myxococcales bacterium]|nr:hypothetical protein [Myxococcales bacterium]